MNTKGVNNDHWNEKGRKERGLKKNNANDKDASKK